MRTWSSPPGAECRARQDRHPRLLEAEVGELAVVHPGPRDVRKAEEPRLRHGAADPGDRVEGAGDEVAPVRESGPDPGSAALGPAERRRRGLLGHHVGAGHEMLVHLQHVGHQGRRPVDVADPPAGHRERLGEAVEGEGALGHRGQGRDAAMQGIGVDEVFEGLVRKHEEIVAPGGLGDHLDLGRTEHAAGGVVGRVEEYCPRSRGDPRREVGVRQHPAGPLAERHADRFRAREADQGVIGDPAGGEEQHLVARVEARLGRERDALLDPDGDDDLVRVGGDPVLAPELVRDRAAKVPEPRAQAVGHVPVVFLERGMGLAFDLGRGVELGAPEMRLSTSRPDACRRLMRSPRSIVAEGVSSRTRSDSHFASNRLSLNPMAGASRAAAPRTLRPGTASRRRGRPSPASRTWR